MFTLDLYARVSAFPGDASNRVNRWEAFTSDPEILETVSGLQIHLTDKIPHKGIVEYPFEVEKSFFIDTEIKSALQKQVIAKCGHEKGKFMPPISLREIRRG